MVASTERAGQWHYCESYLSLLQSLCAAIFWQMRRLSSELKSGIPKHSSSGTHSSSHDEADGGGGVQKQHISSPKHNMYPHQILSSESACYTIIFTLFMRCDKEMQNLGRPQLYSKLNENAGFAVPTDFLMNYIGM